MKGESYLGLIWKKCSKYRSLLFLALFLATINQVFSLLDPLVFKLIVDNYAVRYSELTANEFFSGVTTLLLLAIGAALVSRIAKNFQDYYVNVVSQRVGTTIYSESVKHVLSLEYSVFEDQRSGAVLQKLQKAKQDVQTAISNLINVVFLSLVGIAFVIVYAFATNWIIGVAFVLSIPIIGGGTFIISRKIKAAQKSVLAETTELAGLTTETLRNVELVKSLGLESQEISRLNAVNDNILTLELKKVRLVRKLSFLQGTLINLTRSAILFTMLWLIFGSEITLGSYFTLMIYSFFLFGPLSQLGDVSSQYQEARASYEQLQTILKIPPQKKAASPKNIGKLESIEFRDTTFVYPTSSIASVSGISLELLKGKTFAFAGPSGAGKSTIVKLLVGLYRPTSGSIMVNGTDSKDIDYDRLRGQIGLVSQETQLFAGTIRENLLFVKPDATDSECLEAIRHASAMPIIERGGKGLDTRIGESGIKISGGEKQRIAIARALLRNPDLIIFDEATSSLDSITEREITKTIREITSLRPNIIIVLVAHRLSTIAHADRIYILEKGKIIESGNHDELLGRRGLYEAFWKEQQSASVSRRD